jgi:glycosyltransferase involved in cell wall biosynthesis
MRLVIVNQLHPQSGRVGAVRMWRLAEELAERGHEVVYLCSGTDYAENPLSLGSRLSRHAWNTPLVVSLGSSVANDQRSARSKANSIARRAATAFDLIVRRGPYWRWRDTARRYCSVIEQVFRPDLCYATFGSLDGLNVAQDLAKQCGVPWIMDVKDAADTFIPALLRRVVTSRYRDAAAITINSEFQRRHNAGWAVDKALLLYSGCEWPPSANGDRSFDPSRFALVGSVYSDEKLRTLLNAFAAYAANGGEAPRKLYYFGLDTALVMATVEDLGLQWCIDCAGNASRERLLSECARSAGIAYITEPTTFHHKLLELSAVGRPIVCYPPESDEAIELASLYGLPLVSCRNAQELGEAIAACPDSPTRDMATLVDAFGWRRVAERLADLFEEVLNRSRGD